MSNFFMIEDAPGVWVACCAAGCDKLMQVDDGEFSSVSVHPPSRFSLLLLRYFAALVLRSLSCFATARPCHGASQAHARSRFSQRITISQARATLGTSACLLRCVRPARTRSTLQWRARRACTGSCRTWTRGLSHFRRAQRSSRPRLILPA